MAQLLKISANTSKEVRATVQAMKLFPRELQSAIRKYTQSELAPAWQEELNASGGSAIQQQLLVRTGRVSVSNQNVMLKSATVGKSLGSKGSKPKDLAQAYEFGGDRGATTTYRSRSKKGKTYNVTRHTQRQLPANRRKGYVVFPAATRFIPRAASLWVQTTVKTFYEVMERK